MVDRCNREEGCSHCEIEALKAELAALREELRVERAKVSAMLAADSDELREARELLARVTEPIDILKHPARLHWIAVDEARAFLAGGRDEGPRDE